MRGSAEAGHYAHQEGVAGGCCAYAMFDFRVLRCDLRPGSMRIGTWSSGFARAFVIMSSSTGPRRVARELIARRGEHVEPRGQPSWPKIPNIQLRSRVRSNSRSARVRPGALRRESPFVDAADRVRGIRPPVY